MNDLNLNLFYKTTFAVRSKHPDTDALWQVVCEIRSWICGKWRQRGLIIPQDGPRWTHFKNGQKTDLSTPDGTVRIESAAHWTGKDCGNWACSITEIDRQPTLAPREWKTELGYQKLSHERGILSIVLTYGDRPGFLGPVQPEPGKSIPGIVWRLFKNYRIECLTSDRIAPRGPVELKAGDFENFWGFVSERIRETPVVLISPREDEDGNQSLLVDPQEVYNALGPSALVYYSRDKDYASEMAWSVSDRQLRCSNGAIRVYDGLPRFDLEGDSKRHRFFTARYIEETGSQELIGILRRALAQDVDFYERMIRIDDVRDELRRERMERAVQEMVASARNKAASAESKAERTEASAMELLDEMQRDVDFHQQEAERLEQENGELKTQIHTLTTINSSLESALEAKGTGDLPDFSLGKWPLTTEEIMGIYLAKYPDRLAITDAGLKSLDSCRTSPDFLWNALHDMCTIAYKLYANPGQPNIAGTFNSQSNFELVLGAGTGTRKSNSLMAGYWDTYKGRDILCETHIKHGAQEHDPRFIRIYFAYDETDKVLVISSCGEHKENWTTRARGVH